MMTPKALNPNAKLVLEMIQNETGKIFNPIDDFEEIITLHLLGEQITCPQSYENKNILLDAPLRCGNVSLYRLNFGAVIWLESVSEWFKDDEIMQACSTIYAMAHCREPEKLLSLDSLRKCKRAVTKWINKQSSCVEAFEDVVGYLLPRQSHIPTKESDNSSFGPMMAMLCSELGHDPKFWLWECSTELVVELIGDLSALKWAESSAEGDNPYGSYMKASREMHYYKVKLLEKYGE